MIGLCPVALPGKFGLEKPEIDAEVQEQFLAYRGANSMTSLAKPQCSRRNRLLSHSSTSEISLFMQARVAKMLELYVDTA